MGGQGAEGEGRRRESLLQRALDRAGNWIQSSIEHVITT